MSALDTSESSSFMASEDNGNLAVLLQREFLVLTVLYAVVVFADRLNGSCGGALRGMGR
ncbi:hypothetical protein N657DRAFT_685146 [Parathielavia appendiculata]|uniref:Uncharacterized protein n=1 Tax=Parathielavia appendiculata TaxID=2587402 RepID=A0AAN6TQ22_9PEZI|nr:hypothetical protein N657DRAFT_685146 [Parathielavia appendiculata]